MIRSYRSFVRLVHRIGLVACIGSVLPAGMASAQTATVTISPRGHLATSGSVNVTVEFCQLWGGWGWTSQEFHLDGVDVSSSMSYAGWNQNGTCEAIETWTGTITLGSAPTNQVFRARAWYNGYLSEDNVTWAIPAPGRAVLVASGAGFLDVRPSSSNSQPFTIWNTGQVGTTYSLTASCFYGASSCSVTGSTGYLAAGAATTVNVSFNASGTPNDTGLVKLRATDQSDAGIIADGYMDLTVRSLPTAGVTIARSLDMTSRGACVTASIGSDAAMQCGGLRLTHALPGVHTLGKARVPTLIYNSQLARSQPVALADVTLPVGPLPSSVEVRVHVAETQRGSATYPGWHWGAGGYNRRVAVPIDGSAIGTQSHSYEVEATLIGGSGGTLSSESQLLTTVDRSTSPYGAGWWIAGLEELVAKDVDSTELLWIGGDGSTRRYIRNGAVYRANNYDLPDSITRSGTDFIRWGPARLQVKFDYQGLHKTTTNRLGEVTTFSYEALSRRLSTISVPVRSGSPLVYTFTYDGNGVLYQVTAPNAGSSRVVSLGRSGGKITSITDPDTRTVYFGYGSGSNANRIESRTDRRGSVTTFGYDAASHLSQSVVNSGGLNLTTNLRPAESVGLSTAELLDSAYTRIDGPRTDVVDQTKIWIGYHGAPTRIRNADGREAALKYDATWPLLVSETRVASRMRTRAFYSATTGLMDSTVVYNPLGTGANAKTSYTWNTTYRFVTSVTPPAGAVTEMLYDTAGNRVWQQTGGSTRRTTFAYHSNGQLYSVTPPIGGSTYYEYNALGNLSETISPRGFKSFAWQNAIGQDTMTASPHSDTLGTAPTTFNASTWVYTKHWYDIVGQDTATTTYGPAVSISSPSWSAAADSLRVTNVYDNEGNVTSTKRKFSVNGSPWVLEHATTYDAAGRPTYKSSPSEGKTFTYDPAGNVTAVQNGRGLTVTMSYDPLNRVKERVVPQVTYGNTACNTLISPAGGCYWTFPMLDGANTSMCILADTARFYFDASGNMTRADNRHARVRRAYAPNGALLNDTLRIRTVNEPGDHACGSAVPGAYYGGTEWNAHVYVMQNSYDLAGRRTQMTGPYSLAGCSKFGGVGICKTTWTFGGGAGELSSVKDGLNRTTSFAYDDGSRLAKITFPNGIVDTMVYGNDGRMISRQVYSGTYINDAMAYDAAGRVARAVQSGHNYSTVNSWYNGMGAVMAVTGATFSETGYAVEEVFRTDAIGNRLRTEARNSRPVWHEDQYGERDYTIGSNGSLTQMLAPNNPNQSNYMYDKDLTYDNSGNLNTSALTELDSYGVGNLWDASINYYDAADRLRVFNRHVGPLSQPDDARPGMRAVFEEYFYDALGRRVIVRSRRHTSCQTQYTECSNYVERTVWDGDQVVFEIRAPGATSISNVTMETDNSWYSTPSYDANKYGQTAYVHAGGIDQPLHVMRAGYGSSLITVYPHQNWRGIFELGTATDGTLRSYSTGYPQIAWPGGKASVDGAIAYPVDGPIWFGNLIPGKADGSGMQYMRNRYYDPATGRFTQQDPIGLAGGMNLYGFAGGDPVNFSDPFGLSDCSRQDPKSCTLKDVGLNVLAGMASVANGGGHDTGPGFGIGQALGIIGLGTPSANLSTGATSAIRGAVMNTAKAEGRGGFGVGAMTAGRFGQVAADFAGDGARLSRDGRALVSADMTFVARFPQSKTYGASTSRMVGNLVIQNKAGQPVINAHVPIVLGPAP